MKKPAIWFSVLALILIICAYNLRSLSITSNFDIQTKCATESAKLFKQLGYSYESRSPANSFTNHWNKNLGKCFVLISTADYTSGGGYSIYLLDTAESKSYGDYFALAPKIDSPSICFIYKNGDSSDENHTLSCKSLAEYNTLVRPFMNN